MFGVVVGVALAAGAGWLYLRQGKDCIGRCGDGTQVLQRPLHPGAGTDDGGERADAEEAQASRRAAGSARRSPSSSSSRATIASRPTGDSLGRAEHVDLSQGGDERELQQEDLDAVFRPAQSAISRCITDAVGDYPLESGKIEVAFRVERTGAVRKVRITAPQLLMRRGFVGACDRSSPACTSPPSGGANVVTYPFSLQ